MRERLSAIACDDPAKLDEWLHDRPEARLSVMLPGDFDFGQNFQSTVAALSAKVRSESPAIQAVLHDWLGQVQTAETLADALAMRANLPAGRLSSPAVVIWSARPA